METFSTVNFYFQQAKTQNINNWKKKRKKETTDKLKRERGEKSKRKGGALQFVCLFVHFFPVRPSNVWLFASNI